MKMYTLYDLKRGKYFDPNLIDAGERAFSNVPLELTSDKHRQVVLARSAGRRSRWGNKSQPRLQVREFDVNVPRASADVRKAELALLKPH